MANKFHRLKISEVRRETADCVSVRFEVPPELTDEFIFQPGQNLTLRTDLDGQEVRRSYSICSSPEDSELRIAIKSVPGGRFSAFANTLLKAGDELEVMSPAGSFHISFSPTRTGSYLAFAAGSGITPILAIIKAALATEKNSQFTLVYGNRSTPSIIFREALEAIKNRYVDRFQLIHVLSREKLDAPINNGRIDAAKFEALNGKLFNVQDMDHIFLCGPFTMIESLRNSLQAQGVPRSRIHFELFNSPVTATDTGNIEAESVFTGEATVSVRIDGRRLSFPLSFDGAPILDAALEAGADLPYACKGGVCATCKARLTAGEVSMDTNYALEPEEVAAGFVLTCQSHPRSAQVDIDFDSR